MSCSSERDQQLVAVRELDARAEPVGGALRRDRVEPEALGRRVPERACARRSRRSWWRRSAPRRRRASSTSIACGMLRTRPRPSACLFASRMTAITSATSDSIAVTISLDRGLVLADEPQHSLARLGERRERLERLERGGQPAPVALVVLAACRQRAAAGVTARGPGFRCGFLPHRASLLHCCHRHSTYRQECRREVDAASASSRFAAVRACKRGVDPRRATPRGPAGPGSRRSQPRRSRPVIATRIGWKTAPGFTPRSLDDAAQRLLDALLVERLDGRERLARALRAPPRRRPCPSPCPTPPRRSPPGRRRTRPGRGISASVEIFSCTAATACSSRGSSAPGRPCSPQVLGGRRGELRRRQLADVVAVHPARASARRRRPASATRARARTSRSAPRS